MIQITLYKVYRYLLTFGINCDILYINLWVFLRVVINCKGKNGSSIKRINKAWR